MRIGIISLGLIGSSILKSLSEQSFDITCVTRNADSIEKAKILGAHASNDYETLNGCNIVFVCSPISETLSILDILENIVNTDCIVMDVCSVKNFVMEKSRPYKFIGTHPMAGTENSGFDAGEKDLFTDAKWVICPSSNISDDDISKVTTIIEKMGAKIIIADAKDHDKAVALISHAPMIVAQAIFETIKNNNLAKQLASSGFRDMTRLAMSNTKMANDMLTYNKENINLALKMLNAELTDLQNEYSKKIEQIAKNRQNMYSKGGKNIIK